jgi:hypothetical protein
MLGVILVILIVFWFLGYGPLETLRYPLVQVLGRTITIWDILIFLAIIWLIDLLPRPLREIAAVLLVIWLLSLFGIIAIAGLSNILIIAIIIGIGLYIIAGK